MDSIPVFRILAVDDNPNNLFTLKALLSSVENIHIYEALSGEEALESALSKEVDLILLDIQMPGLDGFEVAKLLKLKQKTKNIPIVFLTAIFKSEEFFEKGYEVGAVDYLTKPIDDNLLLNKIKMYQNLYIKEKTAEEEMKKRVESEKIFQSVFQFSGIGIAIADTDYKIINANVKFEKILGYENSFLIGKKMEELTHQDDIKSSENNLKSLKSKKEISFSMEKRYIKKDGESIYGKVTVSTVRDGNGDIINFIIMLDDLSEYKKLEDEKKRKEQLLIQQSRMAEMGEMIGSIAHQWRQPLNALSIIVQGLVDAYEYKELTKEALDEAVDNSMRLIKYMSKTIDDFRNFFKPNKEKKAFDVLKSIKEVTGLIEPQLKSHSVSLVFSDCCSTDCKCICMGYENEFKQAVLNIVNNGKDAILEQYEKNGKFPGKIYIDVHSVEDKIIVTIMDNGTGIPDNIIKKIFEPYISTKAKNGTGLGLYMTKSIIENNMDGTITACNDEDTGGAKFIIELHTYEES